jgi:UPF0716 protein FxsA
MATGYPARGTSSRLRTAIGLGALAEVVVYVLVASWIGLGWTVLLTLATSALGWALLARQGTKALGELRQRAEEHRAPGRALGDAGLVALGGLLMVLPGFLGDLLGLLCLLPGTRGLVRGGLTRLVVARMPVGLRPPVHVESVRTAGVAAPGHGATRAPLVIEGEVVRGPDGSPAV